jgi:uncharacterized membrane protein
VTWDHNKLWGNHPAVTTGNDRSVGQRAADRMKAILATWIALIVVLAGIMIWMIYNSHLRGGHAFDPYPWILLNLVLSCFAALQCFVLLIANKRGEQIASEIAKNTYDNTCSDSKLLEENTALTRQVKTNTDLLEEIHLHVANIGKKVGAEMGHFPPRGAPPVQA